MLMKEAAMDNRNRKLTQTWGGCDWSVGARLDTPLYHLTASFIMGLL